ncbi:Hydrophobin [Metarhizium rileyi]|uniref:Hydrophobin n=1 Tax=Metarhizium rileyi (strain RCEF 4871) TaxID=1649241 RepID=A0A166WGG1_METRR|nr:Hydrophobin [Metarhizium rileyi RCEF 4871]
MPTYRGPVKASLAQLAAIAPFLAKSAFASNLEVRTVEVFATTYLDIDACYNACPTKAWQEWQTPVTNYVTQTLPAAESCVTTSTSTKHPDCDVCKGTVFIYVPKTEIVEITKVIDPTHSSHMHKPSFSIGIPISSACSGQVACCTGDSNGLINLQCTNVNI